MKTGSKTKISLLLTVSLIAALLSAAFLAVGMSAATDPKEISKVIVDFRNATTFAETGGKYYQHVPTASEPDELTGGKYSWSTELEALKVEYHECAKQADYRFMFHANKTGRLNDEYKYVAVIFRAETNDEFFFQLSNTPKQGTPIVDTVDGAEASGKWAIAIGDISPVDANGKSIQNRWVSGNINTISFITDDKNAEFYIKEVGFFKTAEDAKAYYDAIDLSKSPREYMSAEELKALTVVDSGATTTPTTSTATPSVPLEEQPDPVVMTFDKDTWLSGNAKFTNHADNTEGVYVLKSVDGVNALQLQYSPYGSFADYRCMPAFKEKNTITEQHRYVRITYMTTDAIASQITLVNNKTPTDKAILVENTSASKGEFVTSNVVDIGAGEMVDRYISGMHCTLGFTSSSDTSVIYIKELAFFASPEQAYAYYGDEPNADSASYTVMSFAGTGGETSGTTNSTNPSYGTSTINEAVGALDITYSDYTNHNVNYMAKIQFKNTGTVTAAESYIRVLYAADHPDGVETAVMRLRNDKIGSEVVIIDPALKDTNGEFVLSDTVQLTNDMMHRFAGSGDYSTAMHNSLHVTTALSGGTYSIKAIYFFSSKEAADSFEPPKENAHTLKINGNDITKYQIVVSADTPFAITTAAEKLVGHIAYLTGVTVPVVTDAAPVSEYEIQIGQSNRPLTKSLLDNYNDGDDAYKRYVTSLEGNTLVLTSALPYASEDAVDLLLSSFLYKGMSMVPDTIDLGISCKFDGKSPTLGRYENWADVTNVADPEIYSEDFDTDDGYFTEDNNAQIFNIANGVMSGKATDEAMTYVHVYEKNASIEANLTYTGAGTDADFGLMLRYTGKDAFVKAGYDFDKGCWYILSREGADFYADIRESAKYALTEGTVYNVKLTVNYDSVILTVNGTEVLNETGITQITPGKIGLYAKDITLTADDVNVVLLSGMGTILRNVYHTLLPDDSYREGGSVLEMSDGSINYSYRPGVDFKSLDGGKSWTRIEKWTDYTGYFNIIRLIDGSLLKISSQSGWMYSFTSTDDGASWSIGGKICQTPFRGDSSIAASAVNMNDKINQAASGRIYYSQNYETTSSYFSENNDGIQRKVFCEFYYSDDNGKTWTKSDTDSWELGGNETQTHFGECKIVECADGTVRMYNSWNKYGCIVYSDSTDGGKTFGPLMLMEEFPCARSSMQFFRDPYGETDTTYYMIWVNTQDNPQQDAMPRSSLSLAKSTDGKTWTFLGDIWRWQSNYRYGTSGAVLNHIVDPFIKTTADYVIVGTGLAEHMAMAGDNSYHGAQRQHIWTIAKDTLGEGSSIEKVEYLGNFTDVSTADSYYDAVKFVTEKGLFNGTSETTFSPATTMTRSMFVTVLGRLDGADVSKYTTPTFADVVAGQWYTSYVEWAAANSIVNGIGNGLYGIEQDVTAEQVCVMLARYNGSKSATASGKTLADFSDSASVSTWAAEAVKWAVENGVYEGIGGALKPTEPASRALVATMFNNYVNVFGE